MQFLILSLDIELTFIALSKLAYESTSFMFETGLGGLPTFSYYAKFDV